MGLFHSFRGMKGDFTAFQKTKLLPLFQFLKILLRKNVGAAPCGRPHDGQPQGVAPTLRILGHAYTASGRQIFLSPVPSESGPLLCFVFFY